MKSSHFEVMNSYNPLFFNVSFKGQGCLLSLDIDHKTDILKQMEFTAESSLLEKRKDEFESLTNLAIGKNISELKKIKRSDYQANKQEFFPLGLWLLKSAIDRYTEGDQESFFYTDDKKVLCLCFGIDESDIHNEMANNLDFDLEKLAVSTRATTACGSCRTPINKNIQSQRDRSGIIYGKGKVRTHFDKNGKWVKVAGLFPGPLIIKIDKNLQEWKELTSNFPNVKIELLALEGYHLDLKIVNGLEVLNKSDNFKNELSDFLFSRLGVRFVLNFFH